jgi:serine/threonine-protein kinase
MLQEPSPEAPVPFGRYQLIRRIGAGGMGEVFLARESGDAPRAVVVKKVLPNLIANRAFVGRFLDEAKVVVRLKHPNIARVWAMGEVAGEYYLSMEYVQGKTVSRFTKRLRDRKVDMPLGIALLLAERVCQGLDYAHDVKDENQASLHLVHRDLSPANVCISYKGEVKIIDFGAAQSTLKEEQTAPRVVIGNLTYMAPEQAKKQIVDGRADIYSCGVMLWELLAWHALPQKGDPIERWRKAANPSWEAPSLQQPSVPRDVDDLVLKALKKDPKDRWNTAAELGEALRRARLRHAPQITEKSLGELLSKVFAKEKQGEDEVLYEAVYGQTLVDVSKAKKESRKVQLVPPTALAFEHTAILAPVDALGDKDQDITDPGKEEAPAVDEAGTPLPTKDPRRLPVPESRGGRTSFGVTFAEAAEPSIEPSLIQEIEAIGEDELLSEDDAHSAEEQAAEPAPIAWTQLVIFGGIFCIATSLGFLFVWLAMK